MAKGTKTGGGSRRGRGNRAKIAFREELQAYCDSIGLNPFHQMAQLVVDPTVEDQHLRFLALKELCQYLQPKLRAVELSGNPDHPLHTALDIKMTLNDALRKAYDAEERRQNGHARPNLEAVRKLMCNKSTP
jgi:hypothetical protein